jgi:hypothetical protein
MDRFFLHHKCAIFANILHPFKNFHVTSIFYFNYFRYCRKQSLLECRSHLHPCKWMKHPNYRWKCIYSSKCVYFQLKISDATLNFCSNLAISSTEKMRIYRQIFSQKKIILLLSDILLKKKHCM